MQKIFLGAFIIFVGFIVSIFIKAGAWRSVEISEVDLGPINMVYKDYVGPYHKIVKTIQEVETWAKSKNLDCSESFGEYLDDPNLLDHDRLKGRGGCILSTIPKEMPAEFKSQILPNRHYIQGIFLGSPALGPMKAYGKIAEYIEKNNFKSNSAVIEIYKLKDKTNVETKYLFSVQSLPLNPNN